MQKVFEAIVPGWTGVKMPPQFPAHVRFLLRASVILAHLFAIKTYGRTFGLINYQQRVAIIETLYNHPNATIRSLVQFWKLTALMTQC